MESVVVLLVLLLIPLAEARPTHGFRHTEWQRALGRQGTCPECRPEWCLPSLRCLAGRARDACGCCWECGNGEGQLCDPATASRTFYGRCAEGLRCRTPPRNPISGKTPNAQCVCGRQEVLCGSDQRTYKNVCQLRAAQYRLGGDGKLLVAHHGPCKAKPVIVSPPRDVIDMEGSDIIFSCEVLSYPMAVVEWRKEGNSVFLPADDSNMVVQAHGGPRRFELTGWLQIQTIRRADQGVYTCTARSPFGEVSASARLQVLDRGASTRPNARKLLLMQFRESISEDSPLEQQQQNPGSHSLSDDEDDEDYGSEASGYSY
ncbi:kazal-type serine peptidase inhibitor domain 2 [Brienomyrus brachyistius]|uniref:kazal-type serine peptidase inhibitor domain 2 n=1 Tax=Brienomyrus brachyistius TaxID=42636 RepID=UPI0020B1A52C|nr:kazal-type serine peptidase inhibitor domain 2 [Brienomyrus brachyistius]